MRIAFLLRMENDTMESVIEVNIIIPSRRKEQEAIAYVEHG